ncbi:MAG TPA: hypothetical protein VKA30_12400 [Actinomycetota bacterium]|nr:hypothetical protein [Actinomycetota bacterium]
MSRTPQTTPGRSTILLALALLVAAESIAAATWLVLGRERVLGGFSALVALVVMIGVIPVAEGRRSAFAERLLDRLFDACVLAALAWISRATDPAVSMLALAGLGASYVAAYERARGEGLGFRGFEAMAYRAVRQALLVVALLTGWLELFLGVFLAVTALAAAVRASNVAAQERRRQLANWGIGEPGGA